MTKHKDKKKPGDYGYIDDRRKSQIIKIILWFIIIAAVITFGIVRTGTRLNEATVIGVVLVLPAAKSLIALILLLPYRTGSQKEYMQIKETAGDKCLLYADLVLTRYEGSMCVSIAMIHGSNVFAYIPEQKNTPAKIREYLTVSVKAGGGSAAAVVCTDFNKYMEFAKKIAASDIKISKNDKAIGSDILSRAV